MSKPCPLIIYFNLIKHTFWGYIHKSCDKGQNAPAVRRGTTPTHHSFGSPVELSTSCNYKNYYLGDTISNFFGLVGGFEEHTPKILLWGLMRERERGILQTLGKKKDPSADKAVDTLP